MAEVTEKTIQTFPEEHSLMSNIAGLYLEVMLLIEKLKEVSGYSKMAVLSIGIRNFRLLYCAGDSIYNGFYDVCMILLRVVYENNLLMKYLIDNEEDAKKWLVGKRFKPSYLRMKTEDKTRMYGLLSDYYTHANVESLFSAGVSRFNGKTLSVDNFPQFRKKWSKLCIYTHILTAWMSLLHLQYAFRDSLWKNEDWKNRFAHWNEIVLDYTKKGRD